MNKNFVDAKNHTTSTHSHRSPPQYTDASHLRHTRADRKCPALDFEPPLTSLGALLARPNSIRLSGRPTPDTVSLFQFYRARIPSRYGGTAAFRIPIGSTH